MTLPVTIDADNADHGTDMTVKEHQQHHDALHGMYNIWEAGGISGNPLDANNIIATRIFSR